MATKKETTAKKADTKKKTTKKTSSKKTTTKKEKTLKVSEEQFKDVIKTAVNEKINNETVVDTVPDDVMDKYKTSEEEYDMTNAPEEDVKAMFETLKDDDKIFVTKNNVEEVEDSKVDKEVEETLSKEEEIKVEKPKEEKKITNRINKFFGYLWNGQMIDF